MKSIQKLINLAVASALALSGTPAFAGSTPVQGVMEKGNHGQSIRYGLPTQLYRVNAAGDSNEFSNIMLEKTVTLTAADVIAMSATPKLILAGTSGKTIYIHRCVFTFNTTSTQFTGGGAAVIQYDTSNTAAINTVAASFFTAAAGTAKVMRNGIDVTASAGQGLEITNATAAFAAGTGTVQIKIYYTLV